ncbi:MAG: TIGR03619 family F420-dependent LLM class oxidoreductase [Acidimicrobiia bacterium]
MEIGTGIPHTGRLASPDYIREFCITAEEAGWDGLWGIDHMVMPQHTESLYTLARKPAPIGDNAVSGLLSPNYEMMSTLLWVAGFTSRVKLGTAVAVLTIRNAVMNARQLATLDVFSGGRVLYGIGVGWLKEEADAMNMPWDNRGKRADEHIEMMRAIWTAPGDIMEWHGPYFDLPPMDPAPQPIQKPIPILIGGHSDPALDRAARIGDGWIAASMSPDRFVEHRDKLFRLTESYGRDPSKLILVNSTGVKVEGPEVSASEAAEITAAMQTYASLGVHHLNVSTGATDRATALSRLVSLGSRVLPGID